MGKSIEDMYQDLINSSGGDDNVSFGTMYDNEFEEEEFLTSKEIVKKKEELEEKFGVVPPGDGVIEEEVHFKRYAKKRQHKYTEKEMEDIKKSCKSTIVHDYGDFDIYHMSDEERARNDMLNEIGMKLGGLKRTYRKIDQYIEAMRIVVQAWELLERKGNYLHSKDEFFKLVAQGKIVSNRIIMPKLKKIDSYNIDLIIKYISNPELDPTDLLPPVIENEDDFYNDILLDDDERESEEDEILRLLSPEELEFLHKYENDPPSLKVKDIEPKYIKGYDRRDFGRSRKKKKKNKKEAYMIEGIHEILNKIQNSEIGRNRDYTRSSLITNSMFESTKLEKDIWDDLYFDGSWANDNDVFIYDIAVREELLKQHPAHRSYVTFADEELSRFFKILEDHGINTIDLRRKMDCPSDGQSKSEIKRTRKENKKLENAILQRIIKLNENPKIKKIVSKAEADLNKQFEQY